MCVNACVCVCVQSGVLGSPGARASAGRARGRAGADAKNGLRLARLCLWTSATVASTNLARKNLVMCVSLAQVSPAHLNCLTAGEMESLVPPIYLN